MADYDEDLLRLGCEFLEIHKSDMFKLVAMAAEAARQTPKNDEKQVLRILAHAIAKHPIDPISAADLVNAYAHAYDIVMSSEVAACS